MEMNLKTLGSLVPKDKNVSKPETGGNIFTSLVKSLSSSLSSSLGKAFQKALTSRNTANIFSSANDPNFFEEEQQAEAQKQQIELSKKTNVLLEQILNSTNSCCSVGGGKSEEGGGGGVMGMLGSLLPMALGLGGGGLLRGGARLLGRGVSGLGRSLARVIPSSVKNTVTRAGGRLAVATQKTIPRAAGRTVGRLLRNPRALATGGLLGATGAATALSSSAETVGEKAATKSAEKAGTKTVEKAAAKSVEKAAAKSLGKTAAKGAGKAVVGSVLKKIPFVGALVGAGFAISRALDGDFLGAAGELASGVASTIPGIGTVASVGIDAALMARDLSNDMSRSSDIMEEGQESIGEIKEITSPEELDQAQTALEQAENNTITAQESLGITNEEPITSSILTKPNISPELTAPIEADSITINTEKLSIPRLEQTIDFIRQNRSEDDEISTESPINNELLSQFAKSEGALVAGISDYSNVTASRGISDTSLDTKKETADPENILKTSPLGMLSSFVIEKGKEAISDPTSLLKTSPLGILSSFVIEKSKEAIPVEIKNKNWNTENNKNISIKSISENKSKLTPVHSEKEILSLSNTQEKPQIILLNQNSQQPKRHSTAAEPRMPVNTRTRESAGFSPTEGVDDSGIIDVVIRSLLGHQTYLA